MMVPAHRGDWPLKRLKEITSKIGSGATPRGGKEVYKADGISLIRSLNVYDFGFSEEDLAFISDEQAAELNNVTVQANDILLNITGASVARCCMVNPAFLPARVNQHVAIVRVLADIADPRFVLYCINSGYFKNRLLALAQGGATREALTKTTIEEFSVYQPPLCAQQRIGGVLAAYDELIQVNQKRIGILETMARTLFRNWFVNFRFPGHERVVRVPSALGEIPEGWNVVTLAEITTKIGSGATPRGGKAAYHTDGIALIRSLNIYDYQFQLDNLAYLDDKQASDLKNVAVEPNDVLLNITGASVGRCSLVPTYILPARVNQHVAIIRANTEQASPFFILDSINNEDHKRQLLGLAQGGATREALTKDTIERFKIILPPHQVMSRHAEIAGGIHTLRELLQRQISNLRRTRDLLLPRLISDNSEFLVKEDHAANDR